MQSDFLLAAIAHTLPKSKVSALAEQVVAENFPIRELIELTFHPNEQLAFRCAWILENIYHGHFDQFLPQVNYFLIRFSEQQNLSCRRHYAKILAMMTSRKSPAVVKEILNECATEKLSETVFEWLIDEKNPVAVKSHCLNILADLSSKHIWIREELLQTMDFLVDQESIAFFAKVKQIRKQFKI